MKKLLLLLIIPFLSFGQDLTYVPDDNFEQKLINLGYDDVLDDYVLTNNINTVVTLSVTWSNITDLTGIESFTSLKYLLCYSNSITNLDLSNNLDLLLINCHNNNLINIDISQNIQLEDFTCYDNQLTELDVSQNTQLIYLASYDNQLTELDVSQNLQLTSLICYNNQLTELDVSQNIQLTFVWCTDNDIDCMQVWDIQYPEQNSWYKDNDAIWSLDCNYETSIQELLTSKYLFKTMDMLGKETTNKGFNIEIYDDGSVEKKYILK